MEEKEDKGFVVRDRRKFSQDDSGSEEDKEKVTEAEGKVGKSEGEEKTKAEQAPRQEQERGRGPLPEVHFATFIISLSSSALMHLGEIPELESQKSVVDLPLAKQIIDTLAMLQEKTRGNLDPDENRLMNSVLYDLRLRYVQKSG
jgi:hypothetical protein